MQATADSLQQRYFPPAHSALGGSLFTHAAPSQGSLSSQAWGPLHQGGQHPFVPLAAHHSAPAAFSGGLGVNQGAQPPSLFQLTHGNQPRSGVFGHAEQQRRPDEYPVGQLEQHYLTHLQSSGVARGLETGTGTDSRGAASGGNLFRDRVEMPRIASPYQWMNAEQQLLQQHQQHRQVGGMSRLGQSAAEYEPDPQPAMNLDELSALMQAGRSQALPVLQSQPPLTLAQSYLTQLTRIQPLRAHTSEPSRGLQPLHEDLLYSQSGNYSAWGSMRMPFQAMQRGHGDDLSTAEARSNEARIRVSLSESRTGSLSEQNLTFHSHHPPNSGI